MSRRDCTFLPSQNHGHGAAKAARPMPALPHPCTNFAAASVHGAECCRSGELKEHVARHCVRRSASGLHREKCRGTLVLPVEVSQRDQYVAGSAMFLRSDRPLFTVESLKMNTHRNRPTETRHPKTLARACRPPQRYPLLVWHTGRLT